MAMKSCHNDSSEKFYFLELEILQNILRVILPHEVLAMPFQPVQVMAISRLSGSCAMHF